MCRQSYVKRNRLQIQAAVQVHRSDNVLQRWHDATNTRGRLPWRGGRRRGSHPVALRGICALLLPVRTVLAHLASVGGGWSQVAVCAREGQRRGSGELLGLGRGARVRHVRCGLHDCDESGGDVFGGARVARVLMRDRFEVQWCVCGGSDQSRLIKVSELMRSRR